MSDFKILCQLLDMRQKIFAIFLNYALFQESIVILTETSADTRKKLIVTSAILIFFNRKCVKVFIYFKFFYIGRSWGGTKCVTEDKKILIK